MERESVDWPLSPQAPWGSPSSKEEVTIALIGGQRLLRDATASLLASEDGLRTLGTFESVGHFLEAGPQEVPAVLLLDCDEDDPACWQQTIGRLSSAYVQCGVVMLCREMREEAIRCALEQHVNGVILKSYPTKQIRESIVYINRAHGHAGRLAASLYQGPEEAPRAEPAPPPDPCADGAGAGHR
jgi:DNA-binding NarL/FixJ family response regulator